MWMVSVFAVVTIACCVWLRKPEKQGARYSVSVQIRQPTHKAERAFELLLGQPFRRRVLEDGMISLVYCRGDPQITRVHDIRDGRWHLVPALTVASLKRIDGVTHVWIEIFVPETITITRFAAPIFTGYAKMELDLVAEKLALLDEQWVKEGGPQGASGQSDVRNVADDYVLLNLRSGATWAEVQSAFRTISMQFHPDRMVGLPESIIELGTRRFNEASGAYQRLREQLGSQA